MMKSWLLIILCSMALACHQRPASMADNEDVNADDFISFFRPLTLPVQFSDTSLTQHGPDTLRIGYNTFLKFVPDSVLSRQFGPHVRPLLFQKGRAGTGKEEIYLFVKAINMSRKVLYVLCFDKNQHFVTAKTLIGIDGQPTAKTLVTMDSKYTLSIQHDRMVNGQLIYHKEAWVYNDAGLFTLIFTETNEAKPKSQTVFNPIDTLPKKHKYSGDYVIDKRHFVSFRDGRDAQHMMFYAYFENDDGCKGQLKGEARMVTPTLARYQSNGDPCTLEFSFGTANVRMREASGCGNHRDIKCFFEGNFPKKKEKAKPEPKKKRK